MDQLNRNLYLIGTLRTGYIFNAQLQLVAYGSWLNPFKRHTMDIVYTLEFVKITVEQCLDQLSRGKSFGLLGALKHARIGIHHLKITLSPHTQYSDELAYLLSRIENYVTRFENELVAKIGNLLEPAAKPNISSALIRQTPSSPNSPTSIAITPPKTPPSSPRSLSRPSLLREREPSALALILHSVLTGTKWP